MVEVDAHIPQRGDIIRLQLDPRTSSEQAGYHPAIVISPAAYNRVSKLLLLCPITSRQKGWPFEVPLPETMATYGVVLVDQLRTADCQVRRATFVEKAPSILVTEVMSRLATLVT
ncbi:MAG: type II toxin-antitoxin system PemK/MazF family toxin [Cyanobacteria bacterium J06626_18]